MISEFDKTQICIKCGHEWNDEFATKCPACDSALVTDYISKGIGLESSVIRELSEFAVAEKWRTEDFSDLLEVDFELAQRLQVAVSELDFLHFSNETIHCGDIRKIRRILAAYRVLILGIQGIAVKEDNCCECGSRRFMGHQVVRMDVIVDENGRFHSNLPGGSEGAIYDSETPYEPFACMICGNEYQALPIG